MMEGLGIPPSLIGPNIHIALTKADEISARLARPQESNVVSPFPENFDRRAGVIAGARDSVDAPVGKPTEQVQRPSIVSPFPEDFDRRSDVIAVAIPRKNGPPKIELPQWSSKSPKATQTVTNAHKADTNFVEVVPTINFVEDTRTDSKVDKLYEGLTSAETGGEKDPFIRTKVSNAPGGSSAYGPVQITGTLARDMVARYANEFTREEKDYLDKFINQAQVFLAYGNEPTREGYKPIYDYGGVGDLTSVKDKRLYRQVAKKMISIQLQEVGDDTNAFIRRWRGTAPEEWYLKKIKTVVGDI